MTSNESQKRHSPVIRVQNKSEPADVVVTSDVSDHDEQATSSLNTQLKAPIEEEIFVDAGIAIPVNDYSRDSSDVTSNQSFNRVSASIEQTRDAINQGEEEMAEVDTTMLSQEHGAIRHDIAVESARLGAHMGAEFCGVRAGQGDIRKEQAVGFGDTRYNIAERAGDIRREQAYGFGEIRRDVSQEGQENIITTKDSRHDIINEIDRQADRLDGQATAFYIAGQTNATVAARDLATLTALTEANATAMRHEIGLNVEKVGAASALQAEKIATAVALGQASLARDIFHDGQKTRDLINDMKYHDLNRALVERNTELVNCDNDRGRYRDRYWDSRQDQFGSQFASLQNQLQSLNQNFNSQLAETRQGMVNFGTMAGNAGQQSSTSNNVR